MMRGLELYDSILIMFYVDNKFVYLVSLIPFCIIWLVFYFKRKDLRKEMLSVSLLLGVVSVLTSYFWWTKDWWRPMTITSTIVGIEDFIMGFTTGGMMSVVYNIFTNNKYGVKKVQTSSLSGPLVLIFMACLTAWLFVFAGLTSFWASVITMFVVILFIGYLRKDLVSDSLVSGVLMLLLSLAFYGTVYILSDTWIAETYLDSLSGLTLLTIPIEEFVFWFLAGMWVGPFYEFATGKKLKRVVSK